MKLPNQSVGTYNHSSSANKSHPYRINIPRIINEEIGLGDVIKKLTKSVGFNPCGGCQKRAEAMNQWLVIGPKGRK